MASNTNRKIISNNLIYGFLFLSVCWVTRQVFPLMFEYRVWITDKESPQNYSFREVWGYIINEYKTVGFSFDTDVPCFFLYKLLVLLLVLNLSIVFPLLMCYSRERTMPKRTIPNRRWVMIGDLLLLLLTVPPIFFLNYGYVFECLQVFVYSLWSALILFRGIQYCRKNIYLTKKTLCWKNRKYSQPSSPQ